MLRWSFSASNPHQLHRHPPRPPCNSTRPITKTSARTTRKDVKHELLVTISPPQEENVPKSKASPDYGRAENAPCSYRLSPRTQLCLDFSPMWAIQCFSRFVQPSWRWVSLNLQLMHDPCLHSYAGCWVAKWSRRDKSRNRERRLLSESGEPGRRAPRNRI